MPTEGTSKSGIARRSLLLGAGAAASAVALGQHTAAAAEPQLQPARPGKSGRILNAYYLAANAYTVVPRRVREDMTWMAGIGTTAVSISVLEQDFDSAASSVPSNFTETHADTWVLRGNGTPYTNSRGHRSDPNNAETIQFFKDSTEKLLTQWGFEGIIWDEPKVDGAVELFRQASEHAKAVKPDVTVGLFLDLSSYQGTSSNAAAEQFAGIEALDYFGCDGRPWGPDDPGEQRKVLVGGDGERFISMARENGKRSSDQLMQITRKHVRNYAA